MTAMSQLPPVTKTQAPPFGQRSVRRLKLTVVEGPDAGQIFTPEQEGPIAIGSSPDNAVVLSDPAVSRYHVELRRPELGIEVIDLGSLNGTFAGEIRLERAIVPPGTTLRLGNSVLRLEDSSRLEATGEAASPRVPGLIGRSAAMAEVAALIERLAPTSTSVLIEGETGTGKEVVAQAIHELGPRSQRPFVEVDCGSLPITLIASELFGHERGAFTGADARQIGAFERADGGTLFLDEIGELPLQVQPVLLGALERRRFCRLGSTRAISVDVRVVAATNRDLRAEVNAGTFRADLYYRLAIARLALPPLRERREDIPLLVAHFVEELLGPASEPPFGPSAMTALQSHRWSGNVRELRNVVESALTVGKLLLEEEAPDAGQALPESELSRPYREARARALASFEREYLSELINRCQGNASAAARQAKMDRPYLLSLLRRHGLR